MLSPCAARCQCTLKNPRWLKFPEPSTMALLIIVLWFWDGKPYKSIMVRKLFMLVAHRDSDGMCASMLVIVTWHERVCMALLTT